MVRIGAVCDYVVVMDDRDIDVCVLMLAIDAAARNEVQRKMRAIAEQGDSSGPVGLTAMLREAVALLRQVEGSWTHAGAYNHTPMPASEAEPKFALAAHRARSRFTHEIIRAYAGSTTTTDAPEPPHREGVPGIVVVTLVVAARRELADISDVRSRAELEGALDALAAIDPGDFVAMEVIWSPADEREAVSAEAIEERYPELVRLEGMSGHA